MKTYKVTSIYGTEAILWSDDTFTLHFGEGFDDQCESTPETLAESVQLSSLELIAALGDSNEAQKASAAVESELLKCGDSISHDRP
jgi:hypothetical protein